jgi:hypothetical protein
MINKVPVKKLIEFRRLSERSQSTFANNLKILKKASSKEGGGDYWKRCTSGLSNAFRYNDNKLIQEKIDSVSSVYDSTKNELTKLMYKRNLEILHDFVDFDFSVWRPPGELKFLSKQKILLNIDDVMLQVMPHHVFFYIKKHDSFVGGIWFVVWLDGYQPGDLGIYSETLFDYLSLLYSKQYKIDPNYCLTVDAVSKETASYQQILDGKIPSFLQNTIDMLNKYLR